MERLYEILEDIQPDVDFETAVLNTPNYER